MNQWFEINQWFVKGGGSLRSVVRYGQWFVTASGSLRAVARYRKCLVGGLAVAR